jgi:hypothetical protein
MIKTRRLFGMTIVTGTAHEMGRIEALHGTTVNPGDKLTLLPGGHHVHRNPRRKPILRYIEDQEARGSG